MSATRDACIHALVHFEEASGVFVNSGQAGSRTLTKFGTASGVSSSPKFGTYAYLGPTSASISTGVQVTGLFGVGADQFLLSCWLYLTANPSTQSRVVVGFNGGSNGPAILIRTDGKPTAFASGSPLISSTAITLNQWVHLETHRDAAGVWRLLMDGVVVASATMTTALSTALTTLDVGCNAADSGSVLLNCRIDEVLWMNGYTDHSAAFTPETAAFTDPAAVVPALSDSPQAAIAFTRSWPASILAVAEPPLVSRVYWGGNGRIAGTVKVKGTPDYPVRRRVRLVREIDAVCVGERWSDASTGAYEFLGFDPAIAYTVLAYDGPRVFRASVQDGVAPEAYFP